MYDENGELSRAAIITTNSCTNIKTYANLKYMNQIYLRDQFLMIRDGDGEDSQKLKSQLCKYYEDRNREDADKLPKVTDVKAHMEEIKIYLRGHNLYDIFYGRYREQEKEILGKYIDLADREEFKDILDAIDRFIYFESRKK